MLSFYRTGASPDLCNKAAHKPNSSNRICGFVCAHNTCDFAHKNGILSVKIRTTKIRINILRKK